MPPSEEVLSAVLPVIRALEQCSVSRAIWHLDARERWQMVRDTLLGHPQVRGDLRPRDLPIDLKLREMLAGIAAFQARGPRTNKPEYRYCFGDWLYAFAVLVEPQIANAGADEPPVAHQAVYECFREIRRSLPWNRGIKPDSGEFSKNCPILHRLIAAAGWSIKDWHIIHRGHERLPLHETAAKARLAARAVLQPGANRPPNGKGKDVARYEELQTPNLRLLTVMLEHVQSYIARGQKHWLMRGASAWCSQVLAFVRDEVPSIVPGALLLSDSDVVVTFLIPASGSKSAEAVVDELWRRWTADHFLSRFPRLAEVAAIRLLMANPEVFDVRTVLPDISIRIGESTSLLELRRHRPQSEDVLTPRIADSAVRGRQHIEARLNAPKCLHVKDDVVITPDPPAWLEVRGNNKGGKVSEAFGLTSLVWSLCGTTLKAHWFQNTATEFANLAPGMRMMPIHHREWLKWLGSEKEPLAFLKLDGDAVGHVFTATPIPRRPHLSIELNRLILKRVMSATEAVIRQQVVLTNSRAKSMSPAEKVQALREGVPCHGHDIPVPADLVYIGGDDIFFCLPQTSVATFLAGFSAQLTDEFAPEWNGLRFKFACVTLPSEPEEVDEETEWMEKVERANLWASQLAGDELKEFLKKREPSVFEAIRALSLQEYGLDCELWDPELVPHSGSIDHGVVHGIHVRLTLPES